MLLLRIIRNSKKIPSLSHKTETVATAKLIQENMQSYSIKLCKYPREGTSSEDQKQSFQMFFKIDVLKRFINLKVNSLSCNFIKKGLRHGCFNKNIAKFLRTDSFIEHLYKSKRKEKKKRKKKCWVSLKGRVTILGGEGHERQKPQFCWLQSVRLLKFRIMISLELICPLSLLFQD